MQVSFSITKKWLETAATSCSIAELNELLQLVDAALAVVKLRESNRASAIAEIERLAQSIGFSSAQELLGASAKPIRKPQKLARVPSLRKEVRKPFMNPQDRDSGIYALTHLHDLPEWAMACIASGWTKEELHYTRIANGWALRGIAPMYDPVARHDELVQQELESTVVFQRQPSID